jgi:hypothetical protein
MDKMETLVLAAMKEKAPALHQQLADLGRLKAFVADHADQINDQIVTLTMQLAPKQGHNKAKSLQEGAAILKACEATATEIVLAEMLEFPLDETSPQRPDETTPSAMAI